MVMQHLHAHDRGAILGQQQVIFRELIVVLCHNQCADALAAPVNRHNRRILAMENARCIVLVSAHAGL